MASDQPCKPIANVILAATFEWGIALHDLEAQQKREGVDPMQWNSAPNKQFAVKIVRQVGKDFLLFPALHAGRGSTR